MKTAPLRRSALRVRPFTALEWLCAIAPFLPALVVLVAYAQKQVTASVPMGAMDAPQQATRSMLLQLSWPPTMIFAVYIAGPLWFVCTCFEPSKFSWRPVLLQLATFAAGALFFWFVVVYANLLNAL